MAELLATTDDVNASLDGEVVLATEANTALIQVSVNRSVKAYLSRVLTWTTLNTWVDPETTPDIVSEIAAKFIAAQLYYNETSRTTTDLPVTHYAQILYNEAMAMMNMIIQGTIILPNIPETPVEGLSTADFWPVDDTDRAFTLGKKFYGQNN